MVCFGNSSGFISDMYKSTGSREAVNRMTLVSFVVYVHSCTGILVSLINRELLMTIVIEYIPRVVPPCEILLYFNFIWLNFDVYLIHGEGS